ncbi:glycosyltransferase [Aphanothece microscopica]|uniref:glycosyltransferase n=1 Tax=Aphanothece microscopica TaxID=1049561 RepID=UPI0039846305
MDPPLCHDVYVFHRPNMAREGFLRVLATLREHGATLIADYDDLIFGGERLALASSAVKNGTLSNKQAIKAFQCNLDGMRQFDKVTVSTGPLVDRVLEFNPYAKVLQAPNVIPPSINSIHKAIGTPFLKRPSSTIGYFAGTRSHDKDFPIVEEAIYRVLCENPNFSLLVVGPVSMPRGLSMLPNVRIADVVAYQHLPALMSKCSTVIAPLEHSDFNRCKSRVKFLEAALGGCRLIATPIPDMSSIGTDHLTLAESMDDWYEALSKPLDQDARIDLARQNFNLVQNMVFNKALKRLAGLS